MLEHARLLQSSTNCRTATVLRKRCVSHGRKNCIVTRHLYHSRSMITTSSPTHSGTAPSVPGTVPEEESAILVSQTDCGVQQCSFVETEDGYSDAPGMEEVSSVQAQSCGRGLRTGSAELRDFQAQNRRLLPNFRNPLHVIDGPEERYFIGIIDIFTVYGFKKRLEHWWKRLRHPGQTFSTVSPPAYCTRLCQWVQDHTK